jgi:hypothetical protein
MGVYAGSCGTAIDDVEPATDGVATGEAVFAAVFAVAPFVEPVAPDVPVDMVLSVWLIEIS